MCVCVWGGVTQKKLGLDEVTNIKACVSSDQDTLEVNN